MMVATSKCDTPEKLYAAGFEPLCVFCGVGQSFTSSQYTRPVAGGTHT